VDQLTEQPTSDRRCFALTGGPGVGKTALLDHLGSMGFATVREAARDVIQEQLQLDSDILPWRDQPAFQRHVLDLQLEREDAADGPVVFMDRGIPDGIAYLKAYRLSVFRMMLENARDRYDGVFLIEPHGEYLDDAERREDAEEALMLHGVLKETYRDLGYELISVPSMSVAHRSKFVIERIENMTTTTEMTESKGLEIG
jgi:predicted ATPase